MDSSLIYNTILYGSLNTNVCILVMPLLEHYILHTVNSTVTKLQHNVGGVNENYSSSVSAMLHYVNLDNQSHNVYS